jgi:hypothetical protein
MIESSTYDGMRNASAISCRACNGTGLVECGPLGNIHLGLRRMALRLAGVARDADEYGDSPMYGEWCDECAGTGEVT